MMLSPFPTGGVAFAQDVDDDDPGPRPPRRPPVPRVSLYQLRRICYTSPCASPVNVATAEDVVQEVFVKLIDATARYRGDAPLWRLDLKRMTANAAIDHCGPCASRR